MGVEKGNLDPGFPGDSFNLNLGLNQRIWMLFIIPTALHCATYIADVATDIALVERHYVEERLPQAILTLVLIYAPAIVFFIITLKDEKRWPKEDEGGNRAAWVAKQIGLAVLFPIHAMHRFAGKLFWGLEAIFGPEEQLEDALAEAMKPSNAELYLLLQAFLQATPQALFQSYIVMSYKVPSERIGIVQVLSITTSLLSTAIAAACYMRFETQRMAGKAAPWSFGKPLKKVSIFQKKESFMTTMESQITSDTRESSPEPEDDQKTAPLPKGVPQTAILSLPPLPPNIRARLLKASGDDLPEELKQELTEDQQPLNIRSSLYEAHVGGSNRDVESLDFTITLPAISPIPPRSPIGSMPPSPLPPLPPSPSPDASPIHEAPLPPLPDSPPPSLQEDDEPEEESYEGSVHEAPTNEATGTTTPETNLAEHPSREPLLNQSTVSLNEKPPSPPPHAFVEPPLPPTKELRIEGLTEDEMIGKLIAFTWWLFFILSRILALSALAFFYPWAFAVVTVLHYLGMTSYLFSCGEADRNSTSILRLSLGFVFLFCFLEIRDRFREPRNFAVGFVVLCSMENVVTSLVWFLCAAWTSWWYLCTFYLINISLMISILAMALYHVVLKPGSIKGST